jgi:hypothetical protein
MKNLFKFTLILLFIFVNSVQAQVKPGTAAERLNGLQKRKLLEKDTVLNNTESCLRSSVELKFNGKV